jgi:DNA end-binding protein Ku
MPSQSLWSGNLRLSLVLVPVTLHSAVSLEEGVAFRMIHKPSGEPVRYQKGVRDGETCRASSRCSGQRTEPPIFQKRGTVTT